MSESTQRAREAADLAGIGDWAPDKRQHLDNSSPPLRPPNNYGLRVDGNGEMPQPTFYQPQPRQPIRLQFRDSLSGAPYHAGSTSPAPRDPPAHQARQNGSGWGSPHPNRLLGSPPPAPRGRLLNQDYVRRDNHPHTAHGPMYGASTSWYHEASPVRGASPVHGNTARLCPLIEDITDKDDVSFKDGSVQIHVDEVSEPPSVPPRMYGGSRSKASERLGADQEENIYARSHSRLSITRPATRLANALRAMSPGPESFSMTPGDMMFPPQTLSYNNTVKARKVLGTESRTGTGTNKTSDQWQDTDHTAVDLTSLRRLEPSLQPKLRPTDTNLQPLYLPKLFGQDQPLNEQPSTATTTALPTTTTPATPEKEAPDGGHLAWAHAWCSFLITFNTYGVNTSFGVLQSHYATTLFPHLSPSAISWIGSTQLGMIFLVGPLVGLAVDAGWFKTVFRGSTVGLFACALLTSWCTGQYWQLLFVQGILTGAFMGGMFNAGVVVLMQYFDHNLGVAMGLGAAGSAAGAMVYTFAVGGMLPGQGVGWTLRHVSFIMGIALLPPLFVFRERKGVVRGRMGGRGRVDWRGLVEDRAYLVMIAGLFFAFWGLYFGFYYIISYAQEVLRLSSQDSKNLLIAMSAANLPGRIVPAVISDRCIGPLNTLIPSIVVTAMVVFLWIGTSTHSALVVVAIFYGFWSASIQGMFTPVIHSFHTGYEHMAGVKTGFVMLFIGLACLTGTPVGGALIRAGQPEESSYLGAQLFAAFSLLLSALLLLISRFMKVGGKDVKA